MLENTDKALANIIDTLSKVGTSDALDMAGKVAMYDAQGDLRAAMTFIVISTILCVCAILGAMLLEEGKAVCIAFAFVNVFVFGVSLSSWLSPLNQATAHDPKLALAYTVMQRLKTTDK